MAVQLGDIVAQIGTGVYRLLKGKDVNINFGANRAVDSSGNVVGDVDKNADGTTHSNPLTNIQDADLLLVDDNAQGTQASTKTGTFTMVWAWVLTKLSSDKTNVLSAINVENNADVTDTANVTSSGALMDSELTSIADVKALNQSVVSGASPTFGTANFTDASNKRLMTDAQETILNSVELNAAADQTASDIRTLVGTGNSNFVPTAGTSGHFLAHDGVFRAPSYISQLNNAGVIGKVLTGLDVGTTADVSATDTILEAIGKLENRVATNDDKNTNVTQTTVTGNAGTATKIASITNSNIVQLTSTQTLTNKTLTSPTLTTPVLGTPSSGALTNCTFPTLNQNTTGTSAGLSSTLATSSGGTGLSSIGSNGTFLKSNGSSLVFASVPVPTGNGVIDWTTDNNSNDIHAGNLVANTPTKNQVIMFNGVNFVSAAEGTNFNLSVSSFSSNQTVIQLIGNGVWKNTSSANDIEFTATYNNPPPASANIRMANNSTSSFGTTVATLSSPFTSVSNSININYPSSSDHYILFKFFATDSDGAAKTRLDDAGRIYFYNNIYVVSNYSDEGEYDEDNVKDDFTASISNQPFISRTFSASSNKYIAIAYPSRYGNVSEHGFLFAGMSAKFILNDDSVLEITNTKNFAENYNVYRSFVTGIGTGALVLSTSATKMNRIYRGKMTGAVTITETIIENLSSFVLSNDATQTWGSITTGSNEYMLFAWPTRLGIKSFSVGGFAGGFESPTTVSVTNPNGYVENYYAFRATNPNLGAKVVTTS